MAVPYAIKNGAFAVGTPRQWNTTRIAGLLTNRLFDLHPSGDRIAALASSDEAPKVPDSQLTFLFNFIDELRRRVPLPD